MAEKWKGFLQNAYYVASLAGFVILIFFNWHTSATNEELRREARADTFTMLAWMSAMNGNFKELSGMVKIIAPDLKHDVRIVDKRQEDLMREVAGREKKLKKAEGSQKEF